MARASVDLDRQLLFIQTLSHEVRQGQAKRLVRESINKRVDRRIRVGHGVRDELEKVRLRVHGKVLVESVPRGQKVHRKPQDNKCES